MSISQNFPAISPTLNLNFARSKKLDPRITFTRTSSATRTNAQGLIEVVSTDTPRFEHSYNSSTGSVNSLGLLVEESRSNLITYSEQFDNAAWSKFNAGITTNTSATTAPDGTNSAEKLVENTASNVEHIAYVGRTASNETVTLSVFAKTAERSYVSLSLSNFLNAAARVDFNLSNGAIVSTGPTSADYTAISGATIAYPNGWYRCILTATKGTVNTTNNPSITLYNGSTTQYTGDGTSGVYIWGAQLEAGAFATSYIPTVASTVTRSGDLAYIDLPSTGWYNYSQGSLVFQHSTVPFATGTSPGFPSVGFANTDGSSTNAILYFFTKSGGGGQYLVRDTGTDQAGISPSTGAPAAKVGFAYTTNLFVLARNGSEVGTDASGIVPQSIGTLLLGGNAKNVTNNFNACISNVIYYPRALSSSQLQNLTK
jgi:hypothetical protein